MEAKKLKKEQELREVKIEKAPADGVYPDSFYATTNRRTEIFHRGRWIEVEDIEMDCAIAVDKDGARTVKLEEVNEGDRIVTGKKGVRVSDPVSGEGGGQNQGFGFMQSTISMEKSKGEKIAAIAEEMKKIRRSGGYITVVAGPAVIHTGAGSALAALIREGFVDGLLAGNALAVHDIEAALYGTSLDCPLNGEECRSGDSSRHAMHLRAINKIRAAGSIEAAVAEGTLNKGIMYEAVRKNIDYLLAGSIRDDGPLPETVKNTSRAQNEMRKIARRSDMVLMMATMLHSIATGNILPASTRTVCVDINSDTVTKLADRGSAQALGLVTDVELFLDVLTDRLNIN